MTSAADRTEPAVAFLGYLAARERVLTDASLSLADNRMQHGYVEALRGHFDDVEVVSSVPASLDQGAAAQLADDDGTPVRHIGAPPSRLLRPVSRLISLWRELATWARERPSHPKVLVYYNTFLLYGVIGWLLRRRFGVRVVPIAITMPYRTPDARPTAAMRVQDFLSGRLLRRVDGLIAISPYLGDEISPGVPTCIVRGAVRSDQLTEFAPPEARPGDRRRIVYAGNLSARYNLSTAVAMMDHLPRGRFELHLYGRGALESELRAVAERRADVHVHGAIDESAVADVLRSADLLLALLSTDDHLARYSFPSKLFESLASGTPVLTTALPTLDPAMAAHLVVASSLDPRDLAKTVRAVTSYSPERRRDEAASAWQYLRDHGTWDAVGTQLHAYLTTKDENR